jgi:hypothetical protein
MLFSPVRKTIEKTTFYIISDCPCEEGDCEFGECECAKQLWVSKDCKKARQAEHFFSHNLSILHSD